MVVDLKIDGKNGPIPKIVTAKDEAKKKDEEKKHKVWADLGDTIEDFATTKEKADAVSGLTGAIKGETNKPEKKEESSLAQLRAEPSSENDTVNPPAPAAATPAAPAKTNPEAAIAAAIEKAKHIPPPAPVAPAAPAAPATPPATPAPATAPEAKPVEGAPTAAPSAPAAPAEKDSKKQADTAPGESGASSPISNMIKSKIANAAAKAKKEGKKSMPQKEAAPKSDNPPASPNKKAAEGSIMEAYIKKTATVALKTPDQFGPNAKQNSEQAPPKIEKANDGNNTP